MNPANFFRSEFNNSKILKLLQKSLASQILLLGGSNKPAKTSCKKIEKFPSKVEKKLETTNFSKTSILSKCFSRHVECSIGNPHSHTHTNTHTKTFFARRSKISLWKSETIDKINSFQKDFFQKLQLDK